ncbi:MAG: alpha-amylase family glycosyl hydrolase [Ilumatobacteraceae bacterium]
MSRSRHQSHRRRAPLGQRARAGSQQHRDYYLVYPDRTEPDDWERTLPEVFPEMAPGNFTWDEELQGWVWTTFNSFQWDLNFANPEVFVEMADVVFDLVNLGVDVLRLGAIAFTWKRKGTNCQNQPEAHLIAQAYRALVGIAAPGVLLKAEAIVAPEDLVPYLGAHRVLRDECQIAYHNQLMVMIWSSLATGDARLATEALASLPATPSTATWVNYLRCHDDIGWAVSDATAAAVRVDAPAHRRYLAAFYRGDFPGSFARGAAFSSNPDADDERTCGSAASLAGVTAAHEGFGDLDVALRRLRLGYAIVFGFGGIPLVYMGDELALENDVSYLDVPELAGDSRWMQRPAMDWDRADRRRVTGTVEQRAFDAMRELVAVRRAHSELSAGGETYLHRYQDPAVLAWERRHPREGRCFALANVSARTVSVPSDAFAWAGIDDPQVVLGATDHVHHEDRIDIAPYGIVWVVNSVPTY